MFRLAHISDIHLGPLPPLSWRQLLNKRLTGYLNWKINRKHNLGDDTLKPLLAHMQDAKPDHIAITGDLVNLSLTQEFERVRIFLENLAPTQGLSIICGNHDAYVPGAFQKAVAIWKPYLTSDQAPQNTIDPFPYLRKRGDIAMIGCNSAEATLPFFATGYFRAQQARRLAELLQQTQAMCRIVMIHHPPISGATKWHKRLIGLELFQDVIKQHGAELVLHGHTHLATHNEIAGPVQPVPVICVPAAGNGTGGKHPSGRYNLFEIEKTATNWSIDWKSFGWADNGNAINLLESGKLGSARSG